MIKAGVIGATGYAGQQLAWFLHHHSKAEIQFLASHNHTGMAFHHVYGQYVGSIQKPCIDIHQTEEMLSSIDVLFLALPHGKSFSFAQKALSSHVKVIDLGADFRLNAPAVYQSWYGLTHENPELLPMAVYGLPELYKESIQRASLIANPGCYPTASILALAPLFKLGIIDLDTVIIDAKSGVSGAGRTPSPTTLFSECNESMKAYGIATHRHTPEIEQELTKLAGSHMMISFTPHLVPMNRGILATCYMKLIKKPSSATLYQIYRDFYKDAPFVRILEDLPETRWVRGSNFCDISLRIDERTGRLIVVSAIDNLMKGASGQAIQNMNLLFGIKETTGLEILPMIP